jgi:hypothetical protein
MTQAVEHLSSKQETLNSNPSPGVQPFENPSRKGVFLFLSAY